MIPITRLSWIATLLLVIGVGLIAVGFWFGAEAALFAVDGSTTMGTVIDKRVDAHSSVVTVTFTPESGKEIRANLRVDRNVWDRLVVGQPVAVLYVRALPDVMNTLGDESGGWSAGALVVSLLMLIVGAGFATFGAWFLVSSHHRANLVRRLMAVGVETTGTVVDNDAAELRIRYNLQRRLRYRYTDGSGRQQTGLSDWMPRAEALDWPPGAPGVVRYDPDRPEASTWFGQRDP
jgi:hypothetical protein